MAAVLEEHQSGRADHGKRLWALCALELWLARFASL
jgi:asparagine synthase (glutamine-hydrolysing)